MPSRIEDYALIGDCRAVALVARDGSVDWLCTPRFDSAACFAALLGDPEHGRWLLAPAGAVRATHRRYREGTLVLETEFETDEGTVAVVDCMPTGGPGHDLVRRVEGRRGRVPMRMQLIIRFDYGSIVPWVQHTEDGIWAIAGPDSLQLLADVPLRGEGLTTVAEFAVGAGQAASFALAWHASHEPAPPAVDAAAAIRDTETWWRAWSGRCTYRGEWREAVVRSLITLKALTYEPTGGIVAAATTSLPEQLGGVRNWDYRFCWLRDATFTLFALLNAGYRDEARAWRAWLLRSVAGRPAATNIMYGLAGERRLTELELDWLPGYEGARPVRIGNAACRQFQLDVYGEVLDAMYQSRKFGLEAEEAGWRLEQALLDFVGEACGRPDEGIWEVRGPKRHFVHSKVMAWVAMDRAIKSVEDFGLSGPVDEWRRLRSEIHAQVCREGFDAGLGSFVQSYGAKELDASLLMIPLVGFLPADDPRVRGTVEAIERHLMRDGFVDRYTAEPAVDGLPAGEGAFLACTFWLADCQHLLGRHADARRTFARLLGLRNDVGLLAEEYDPRSGRQVGNFPQAFSHIGLVNTAMNLSPSAAAPAEQRPEGD
jgi:GH15 family glucan-1,4-alpha-glucosidase